MRRTEPKNKKRCSRCHEEKPLAAFGRCTAERDGLQYACRACMSAAQKLRLAKITPEQREIKRGYARKDYAKHRARRLAWHHRYREESRDAVIASDKRSKAKSADARNAKKRATRKLEPQKHYAQDAAKKAIRNGILVPGKCEVGRRCLGIIQGHHDDYLKPLSVRWMCRRHHQQWHSENGQGLNATAPIDRRTSSSTAPQSGQR